MTHYKYIEKEFGTSGYADEMASKIWSGGGYSELPSNEGVKVDESLAHSVSDAHFDKKLSIKDFHIKIQCIKHLPAGVGFYLGILLRLPIITCTHMAELFAAAFFVFMGCITIKIAPIKKEVFAFCMLIPETLQQCTSVNYDAVLIPCSMFLFAFILHLYYREEKVGWKDVLVIATVTIVIVVTKIPYAAISLCVLIIPASHYELNIGKKIEIASLIRRFWYLVLMLAMLAGFFYVYSRRHTPDMKTLVSDIMSFPEFLKLLWRTGDHLGYYHIQQLVGMFGWLDSVVSSIYIIIFFSVMVYLNSCITETVEGKIGIVRRAWLLLISIIIFMFIEAAIQSYTYEYLDWDRLAGISTYRSYISDLDMILGVQGRYWIPILPIILVSFSGETKRKKTSFYYIIQLLFYALSAVYVIGILYNRYWIG